MWLLTAAVLTTAVVSVRPGHTDLQRRVWTAHRVALHGVGLVVPGMQVPARQVLRRRVCQTMQSGGGTIRDPRRGNPIGKSCNVIQHVVHAGSRKKQLQRVWSSSLT